MIDKPEDLLIKEARAQLARVISDHKQMFAEAKNDAPLSEYLAKQLFWFEQLADNLPDFALPPVTFGEDDSFGFGSTVARLEQFIGEVNRCVSRLDDLLARQQHVIEAAEANLAAVKKFIGLQSPA